MRKVINTTVHNFRAFMLPGVIVIVLVLSSCSADCAWVGRTIAWVDENENGHMDEGEIPLEGVSIYVDDVHNEFINVAEPVTTDEFGEARLDVWLPGCPDVDFEIYTDVPEGYRLTTNSRLEASKTFWRTLEWNATYSFGFSSNSK